MIVPRLPPIYNIWSALFASQFKKELSAIELPVIESLDQMFSAKTSDSPSVSGFPTRWKPLRSLPYQNDGFNTPDPLLNRLIKCSRIKCNVPLLAVNSTGGGRYGWGPDISLLLENRIHLPEYRWENPKDQVDALESIRSTFGRSFIRMVYRTWDQRLYYAESGCTHRFGCAYKHEVTFRPSPPTILEAEIDVLEVDVDILEELKKQWAIFAICKNIEYKIWKLLKDYYISLGFSDAHFRSEDDRAVALIIRKDPTSRWATYIISVLSEQNPSQCYNALARIKAITSKTQSIDQFLTRQDDFCPRSDNDIPQ